MVEFNKSLQYTTPFDVFKDIWGSTFTSNSPSRITFRNSLDCLLVRVSTNRSPFTFFTFLTSPNKPYNDLLIRKGLTLVKSPSFLFTTRNRGKDSSVSLVACSRNGGKTSSFASSAFLLRWLPTAPISEDGSSIKVVPLQSKEVPMTLLGSLIEIVSPPESKGLPAAAGRDSELPALPSWELLPAFSRPPLTWENRRRPSSRPLWNRRYWDFEYI